MDIIHASGGSSYGEGCGMKGQGVSSECWGRWVKLNQGKTRIYTNGKKRVSRKSKQEKLPSQYKKKKRIISHQHVMYSTFHSLPEIHLTLSNI